ncbi:MAG TPA: hypothetical protein ENK02_07715 [Planctomycetes bacterium]|nr:hypothetical protein [Planctomycetota bacterium]
MDLQESLDKVLGSEEEEFFEDPGPTEEGWELEGFEEAEGTVAPLSQDQEIVDHEQHDVSSAGAHSLYDSPAPGAGGATLWGGVLLLVLGTAFAGLSLLGKGGPLTQALEPIGLEPSMLFLSGLVLVLIGNGQRKAGRNLLANIEASLQSRQDNTELERLIAELREAQQQAPQSGTPMGDHQIAFTKLENMITSLTKATRMYNKPLVDLVGMMTDQGKELEEIRSDLEGLEKAMAESAVTSEKKFEGLVERLRGDTQELEEIFEKSRETLLAELKPFVGQKADQAGEKLQLKLKEDRRLLKETFENLGTSLESRIKEAFAKMEEKEQDPKALQRLESSLNDLIATVRKIEKEGVQAGAPAMAGVGTGPSPTPASAAAPAASPTASASSSPKDSGTQPTPGRSKKVMSAIEKLKQLRGDA